MASDKVYEIVTDRIVEALDKGVVPWRKPWTVRGIDGGNAPMNVVSNKRYHGFNVFILLSTGFASKWWLTFKQAKELGGSVKKGSRGTPVIYWTFLEHEDKQPDGTMKKKRIPFLRYYTVFNLEQTENVRMPAGRIQPVEGEAEKDDVPPIEAAEKVVAEYVARTNVNLVFRGDAAYYSPATDAIVVPVRDQFKSSEAFYGTVFHECVHSTGAANRLGRLGKSHGFGDGEYSREELVAEFGASMVAAVVGIVRDETIENAAAYIAHWKQFVKDDPRAVVVAAGAAQKAADFILNGKKPEPEAEEKVEA